MEDVWVKANQTESDSKFFFLYHQDYSSPLLTLVALIPQLRFELFF
jgi:hypothetical protein